jgi:hypothetical protein
VVPHLATNWAISRLSAQIGRDAEFSRFYGRGYRFGLVANISHVRDIGVHDVGSGSLEVVQRCARPVSVFPASFQT